MVWLFDHIMIYYLQVPNKTPVLFDGLAGKHFPCGCLTRTRSVLAPGVNGGAVTQLEANEMSRIIVDAKSDAKKSGPVLGFGFPIKRNHLTRATAVARATRTL